MVKPNVLIQETLDSAHIIMSVNAQKEFEAWIKGLS